MYVCNINKATVSVNAIYLCQMNDNCVSFSKPSDWSPFKDVMGPGVWLMSLINMWCKSGKITLTFQDFKRYLCHTDISHHSLVTSSSTALNW